MTPDSSKFARALLAFALAAGGAVAASDTDAAPEPRRLTLERLYSLPWLIGTAPEGPAWSPDGRHVAFLWNDQGYNFKDVWLLDVEDPGLEPRRLTSMPRPEAAPESDSVAAAQAAEAVERDPGVTTVTWHPDGERLVAATDGELWLLADGVEPRALAGVSTGRASFSPDGGTLAYLQQGDLWAVDFERAWRGEVAPQRLTRIEPDDAERPDRVVGDFRWSPAGDRLAVLEVDRRGVTLRGIPDYLAEETAMREIRRAYPGEEPTRQRLGMLDMEGASDSEGRDRADGPIEIEWLRWPDGAPDLLLDYRWSPDGLHLAVDSSDLFAKDRQLWVFPIGGNEPTPWMVSREIDPLNETFYFWRIAWAPDSDRLYFLSDREEDYHVYSVDVGSDDGQVRWTHGDWAVASIHPVADELVVVGNRGRSEERHLFRIGSAGDEPVRLSRSPGTHAPVLSPDGRFAAVTHSSDDTPPDLLLTSLAAGGDERRVTRSPVAEFADYRWVTPHYVSFPSHVDGSTLHGRLTLPPGFDPARSYPAILGSVYTDSVRNQWGGRTAHPTWGLDQFLAQEGYVLLNVDMRGSWGRGRAHRRGIRLDYGGMDIEDLESATRFLGSLGYVDSDRIGIWGSSYGGLMTAMSLFRKPGLYAAGVAGAPATNVWHALTGQMAVMMRPQDQPAEYADSSPFMHAHGLEDPLMIIHGMRDPVVLFKDSVVLVERLIQLDKDVDLVALPNAGHGWDNEGLAQTRFAFRKLVGHFDRHLKGAESDP